MAGLTNMDTPAQVVAGNIKIEENRVKMPIPKLIVMGILAGMFIALGAAASSTAMHNIANVGVARLVGGCIFPIGLMMIVLLGGELFTGDCLLMFGIVNKKVKVLSAIRVLVIVWLTNLIGAVIISLLVAYSGQYNYTSGLLGAYTIKVAYGKCNISFAAGITSGILCNIFVCGAVLMAAAAKSVVGKIWACFFPIMAFVVSGYEHCVANMYYIPAGIIAAADPKYAEVAQEQLGMTADQIATVNWQNFFVSSSIPVTIGNILGGMVFVAVLLYLAHQKEVKAIQDNK